MDASHPGATTSLFSRHAPLLANALTAVFIAGSFWVGAREIRDTSPYVQHVDERTLMRGAKRVLQNGDLNPRIFAYPSLPFYLTAAGLAWGVIQNSDREAAALRVRDVGRLEPPFYERARVGASARKLWLVLGVACVASAALLARQLSGPLAMSWAALALALIGLPVASASNYLSVDVPLTLFATALLTQLMAAADSTAYRARVWLPALLCGAAMASKYTGIITLAPALCAVWLGPGPNKPSRSFELVVISVLVFLVLCPRFLLDLPSFVDGIAAESFHYRFKGHRRFSVEPGLAQLFAYASDVYTALGPGLCALSVFGAWSLARAQPRRAAVLLSFPACWVAMLCGVKVHFVRNLLPVLIVLCVCSVAGGVRLVHWAVPKLQRPPLHAERRRILATAVLMVAVALGTLPFDQIRRVHARHVDSRVRFAREYAPALGSGSTLLIPTALPFSIESLPDQLAVKAVDLSDAEQTRQLAQPGAYMLLPHWSTEDGGVGERVAALAPGLAALPRRRVIREVEGEPAEPGLASEMSNNPAFALVQFEE